MDLDTRAPVGKLPDRADHDYFLRDIARKKPFICRNTSNLRKVKISFDCANPLLWWVLFGNQTPFVTVELVNFTYQKKVFN